MSLKYFSMFSGIGGFELGIHRSFETQTKCIREENTPSLRSSQDKSNNERNQGLANRPPTVEQHYLRSSDRQPTCVGFSEIDKYAIQIYKKHFPTHKEYGDVTNIKWSDVENFEMLVGGFPCQSFSIAGKRRGFNDIRGTLFFEIARAAQEKQPRLLLLENVKGLLSHDKGRTFGTILNTLDELGYDLQWQVLNSKNFGVPQNRERVFIVGHFRTTPRPQVFPLQGNAKPSKQEIGKDIANTLTDGYLMSGKRPRHKGKAVLLPVGVRRIRRLTPIECERLQGFPDGWTSGISDTQRYKCLGNAVTVNVVSAIIRRTK